MAYLPWSGLKDVDMALCFAMTVLGRDGIRIVFPVSDQVILNKRDLNRNNEVSCDKKPLK